MGAYDGFDFSLGGADTSAPLDTQPIFDLTSYQDATALPNSDSATWNPSPVDNSTVATVPATAGTTGNFSGDVKGLADTALSVFKDVTDYKGQVMKQQLANDTLNMQGKLGLASLQTQANISNDNLHIQQSKADLAGLQAETQLGIAKLQSAATLEAVRQNPLSSQFVTGHGLLGNLSADGKISLFIGIVSIWLMVRHRGH